MFLFVNLSNKKRLNCEKGKKQAILNTLTIIIFILFRQMKIWDNSMYIRVDNSVTVESLPEKTEGLHE